METVASQEQKQFTLHTLVVATKDFHPSNKLGQGGFGPVFKVLSLNFGRTGDLTWDGSFLFDQPFYGFKNGFSGEG